MTRRAAAAVAGFALALAALPVPGGAAAAARDPLVRVEPPAPTAGKSWPQIRREQTGWLDELAQWGIKIEAEKKYEGPLEGTPDHFSISTTWTGPDTIAMSIAVKSPGRIYGLDFKGSYELEISPEALSHSGSFAISGITGDSVSAKVESASDKGLGYDFAGTFKRGLLAFKTALSSDPAHRQSYGVSLEMGLMTLKLDPVKYVQHFIEFAPRFAAVARGPAAEGAAEAARAVQIQLDPGLMVAAVTNNAVLWLTRLRAEKAAVDQARAQLLVTYRDAVRDEAAAWRSQAADARLSLDYVDAREAADAKRSAELRAEYGRYLALAASPSRPQPPPRPVYYSSGGDSGSSSSSSSSGGGRSGREPSEPRGGGVHFNSPTFNYLRGGGSF